MWNLLREQGVRLCVIYFSNSEESLWNIYGETSVVEFYKPSCYVKI